MTSDTGLQATPFRLLTYPTGILVGDAEEGAAGVRRETLQLQPLAAARGVLVGVALGLIALVADGADVRQLDDVHGRAELLEQLQRVVDRDRFEAWDAYKLSQHSFSVVRNRKLIRR